MNFEFKMASLGNVVFSDRRIMDVAFLISLTNKNFFMISPPPPHSCLFLVLWFVFFRWLIALTFAGNTCLMKVSVCICIGFAEFNKPAMCKISHSHYFSIMLFVLPFRTEHSTYFILSKVCHFVSRLKHKNISISFFVFHFVGFPRT